MTDFDATVTFLEKRRADEHSGDEQNGIKCQRDAWRDLSNATLSWLGGESPSPSWGGARDSVARVQDTLGLVC